VSYSIADLRAMSDEQLIGEHDEVARTTSMGTAYFVDELERRSRERSTAASNRLARASFILSIVSTLIAVVAIVVSLIHR
jgi:hypothetical protein